ncbi:MAG: GTPase [Acidimicrobiia bacterium]
MRRVVIVGAGGRDFHTFNTVFRGDPTVEVVAFTAAQIPNIDHRTYPPELAGERYPAGIPIVPEARLVDLIREHAVDEVVFAYSDIAHPALMHLSAQVLAAGADFRLIGFGRSALRSRRPVIAVCATRTGCGKSQTSRAIARILQEHGLRVALVRHPMPYGNLRDMRVQRFRTLDDIDTSDPTIEEREEYELPVREGITVYAGVDYAAILTLVEDEADVVLWDGGNNDLPFYRPDLMVVVADALRPGHESAYHPGEVNVLLADVLVVNKVDTASPEDVAATIAGLAALNPTATLLRAMSPPVLDAGPSLAGMRVLVVEDGPTITHGGMSFGAGTVAARAAGAATLVDPRPHAVGSLQAVYEKYPHIGPVLPAMGYGDEQLAELAATIDATPCDVIVSGTPIDLAAVLPTGAVTHPLRHVAYDLDVATKQSLAELLAPWIERWSAR